MATPPRRRRRRSQADRDRLIEEAVKIENERMAGMKIRLNDDPWQPLRLALRDIDDYGPDSAPMDARATARERLIEAIRAAPGIPDDCRHELAELLVRAKLVKRAEGRPKEPATAFRMVWLARAVDWLAEVNDRHQLRPAVMRKVARVESAGKGVQVPDFAPPVTRRGPFSRVYCSEARNTNTKGAPSMLQQYYGDRPRSQSRNNWAVLITGWPRAGAAARTGYAYDSVNGLALTSPADSLIADIDDRYRAALQLRQEPWKLRRAHELATEQAKIVAAEAFAHLNDWRLTKTPRFNELQCLRRGSDELHSPDNLLLDHALWFSRMRRYVAVAGQPYASSIRSLDAYRTHLETCGYQLHVPPDPLASIHYPDLALFVVVTLPGQMVAWLPEQDGRLKGRWQERASAA
jgi:hypothetical protein